MFADQTTSTHPGPPQRQTQPSSGNSRVRAKRRVRNRVLQLATAMAAVLVASISLTVAPASATPISTPYFAADSTVTCDPTYNTAYLRISNEWLNPAYKGMWVRLQTYLELQDAVTLQRTANWSDWSGPVQLQHNFQTLSTATSKSDNVHYRMYTRIVDWTGTAWSAPVGNWATLYMAGVLSNGQRGTYHNGFCFT
jgi:hypothetical protein